MNTEKIELSPNLQEIERMAFGNCPALKQLTIPKNAIVAEDAFSKKPKIVLI